MPTTLTDLDTVRKLEPVAERHLEQHLRKAWHPQDYVPWDDGRNFAAMGGVDWEPGQSELAEVARTAMVTNLRTEDNLPSYHREISESLSLGGSGAPGRGAGPQRRIVMRLSCATIWSLARATR